MRKISFIDNALYNLSNSLLRKKFLLLSRKHKTIKLHLGAGNVIIPNYINIDIRKLSNIDIVADITDLSFISDNSVDEIYVCHTLEHISHQINLRVLKEWLRVLKSNAKIIISVPDFDKIIKIYNKSGKNIWNIKSSLMGEQDYKEDSHYSVYNFTYLKQILERVGFTNVRYLKKDEIITDKDWSLRKIKLPNGDQYEISLNIVALK